MLELCPSSEVVRNLTKKSMPIKSSSFLADGTEVSTPGVTEKECKYNVFLAFLNTCILLNWTAFPYNLI